MQRHRFFRHTLSQIPVLTLLLATLVCADISVAAENFAETRARAERGDAAAQFDLGSRRMSLSDYCTA